MLYLQRILMYSRKFNNLSYENRRFLCDLEGICRYLKIKSVPKSLKSNDGNAKLNNLYAKVQRAYLKGYQTKELISALDMAVIRNNNQDALKALEKALNLNQNTK